MSRLPLPPRSRSERLRDLFANPVKRTILLWVFLLVMFIGLWQVFRSPEYAVAPPPTATAPAAASSPWAWFPVVFFVLFGWFWLRARRFMARNKEATDALARGDVAAAAAAFERLAKRSTGALRTTALHNLGVARFASGELPAALEAFAGIERAGRAGQCFAPAAASWSALAHALLGDLDAAARWSEEAGRRASRPTAINRLHHVADAVVALRRGDPASAVRTLDARWAELERSTSADLMKGIRLLRAFAARATGDEAAVAAHVGAARPFTPGQYEWLVRGWPELARFVADMGLSAAG